MSIQAEPAKREHQLVAFFHHGEDWDVVKKRLDQRLDDLISGRVKGLTLDEFCQAVRRPKT